MPKSTTDKSLPGVRGVAPLRTSWNPPLAKGDLGDEHAPCDVGGFRFSLPTLRFSTKNEGRGLKQGMDAMSATVHKRCRRSSCQESEGGPQLSLSSSPKVVDPPQEEWGTNRAESESPDCE